MMPVGTQWGPPMTSGTFSLFKAGFSRKPCLSTGGSPDIFWSHKPPPLEQSPSHPFIRETPPFVTKPMGFLVVGKFSTFHWDHGERGWFLYERGDGMDGMSQQFPWLVVTGCHQFHFPRNSGFLSNHPNWLSLIFFRGVAFQAPTRPTSSNFQSFSTPTNLRRIQSLVCECLEWPWVGLPRAPMTMGISRWVTTHGVWGRPSAVSRLHRNDQPMDDLGA